MQFSRLRTVALLAGLMSVAGFVLGRVFKDLTILPRQIMLFRDLVRTTFLPAG